MSCRVDVDGIVSLRWGLEISPPKSSFQKALLQEKKRNLEKSAETSINSYCQGHRGRVRERTRERERERENERERKREREELSRKEVRHAMESY